MQVDKLRESCPSGWLHVPRRDGGERKGEFMVDEQGCYDQGSRRWQLQRPDMSDGMFEIASNNMYCKKGNNNRYQPACCEKGSKSAQLYSTCSWSDYPDCKEGSCSNWTIEFARSMTGSDGAYCKAVDGSGQDSFINNRAILQERRHCCPDDDDNEKWTDCE
ncbi:hypothetical protein ACJZ2D_004126 [Fusarium nematophilum]